MNIVVVTITVLLSILGIYTTLWSFLHTSQNYNEKDHDTEGENIENNTINVTPSLKQITVELRNPSGGISMDTFAFIDLTTRNTRIPTRVMKKLGYEITYTQESVIQRVIQPLDKEKAYKLSVKVGDKKRKKVNVIASNQDHIFLGRDILEMPYVKGKRKNKNIAFQAK